MRSRLLVAGWVALMSAAGCASIIDFDAPFEQTGGASSTSTAHGGSGGSGTATTTTSTATTTTTSSTCVPTTTCVEAGYTCGMLFDGCQQIDCGSCTAPFTCMDGTHQCECPSPVNVKPALVADAMIQNHPSWTCGTLTSGDFPCLNVSQALDDARGLLKYSLDAATSKALMTPGSVISAKLRIMPSATCGGSSFTPSGTADVYVLRSDWHEMQARWCHRSGATGDTTTAPWGMPGANDTTLDHGPRAGTVTLPATNVPFDIQLEPAELASPLVTAANISFLILTPVGTKLVFEAREGTGGPVLEIDYCPTP